MDANTIQVSLTVPRYNNLNSQANEMIGRLMNTCKKWHILYIDHTDTNHQKGI